MSKLLINSYLNQLDVIKKVSGSHRETIIREAFKDLLKAWGKQKGLVFLAEYPMKTATKTNINIDGALLHELRLPLGYWEAKDENDDLAEEIGKKFRKGYPQDNIVFSDDVNAVLWQNRKEIFRCEMADVGALEKLLKLFFGYERPEIASFRSAVQQFKNDLPAVLKALREMIERAHILNEAFRDAQEKFLVHAKEVINPILTAADVREMLIQHILTEDIFSKVFDDSDFHQHNNVARELYALEKKFFTGTLKRETLKALEAYYSAIRAAAASISSHNEKQSFLKVIYENFYKVYNPKAADRLGVVYTPSEIVRFMIDGTDWLVEKNFGKSLIDRDVEILDPATGTGTFICELLEHFRGQPVKMKQKYANELYANEVGILPYYVANLNIELTYAAITGSYDEFPNLCFVDTLDNVGLHTAAKGTTGDLFGSVSDENVVRIKRQNSKRISVIIGNPPYNANQASENDNNKNREYQNIDARIRSTYIEKSSAQKTKLYDMYARFFRWASDRLDENGILAFVSNRSFIESRTFDGFRKTISDEFSDIYVVDLGGDIRANPRLSGSKHNVFGIQTGVAISFLVKRSASSAKGAKRKPPARIFYARRPEFETAEEKLVFLGNNRMRDLDFEEVEPDTDGNWVNLTHNDFETLLPLGTKETKASKTAAKERSIFKIYSLGVATNRDDWVYDFAKVNLEKKVRYLIDVYNSDVSRLGLKGSGKKIVDELNYTIKWTRSVKRSLTKGVSFNFDSSKIVSANYRPFVKMWMYRDNGLNEMPNLTPRIFGQGERDNPSIVIMGDSTGKPFFANAIKNILDLNYVSPASGGSQTFPRYHYSSDGIVADNVTDWAVRQFNNYYKQINADIVKPNKSKRRNINKDEIFNYCYAVLHDPQYRKKYSVNLNRQFPRIPLYPNFWMWEEWGACLSKLHIDYENSVLYSLNRIDVPDLKARAAGMSPKAILKANQKSGTIILDTETTLSGIPDEAWEYRLGNRSALEWVLDQYREKKPKDETVRENFNAYAFADYKEAVIGLLARLTTVSVETVRITKGMDDVMR